MSSWDSDDHILVTGIIIGTLRKNHDIEVSPVLDVDHNYTPVSHVSFRGQTFAVTVTPVAAS